MRFRLALSLATFFLVYFTLAVGRSTALIGLPEKTPAAEIRSVSGRIASVGDAEFTLDLNKKEPEKLTFLSDSETKMEGKLAIGANAVVDYRSFDGKNVATQVVVAPDPGLRP